MSDNLPPPPLLSLSFPWRDPAFPAGRRDYNSRQARAPRSSLGRVVLRDSSPRRPEGLSSAVENYNSQKAAGRERGSAPPSLPDSQQLIGATMAAALAAAAEQGVTDRAGRGDRGDGRSEAPAGLGEVRGGRVGESAEGLPPRGLGARSSPFTLRDACCLLSLPPGRGGGAPGAAPGQIPL